MVTNSERPRRANREATAAALRDAAEELFSADGFEAVTVRASAARAGVSRAGVSHALVHRYLGSKGEVFRAVLSRNQGIILAAAPDNPDLLATTSLIMREGLTNNRRYSQLVVDSALHSLPHEQTTGRFKAVDRLVELAGRAAASASPGQRTDDDLDPRFVIACVVALYLGWAAAEDWTLQAVGLHDMDDAEILDSLVRVILGILRRNVPGLEKSDPESG